MRPLPGKMSQLLIQQYLNEIDRLRKFSGSITEGVISEGGYIFDRPIPLGYVWGTLEARSENKPMSVLSRPYFHDEAAAFEHVESMLWPQGPVCHHCGSMEKHYALKGGRTKASKKNPHGLEIHGLYKCSDCRKKFTVRMGTIFEESHLPLHKWLQALHAMCASKKGVSAHQLHRALEITYKTAWFMCHRIREAMRSDDFTPMGGAGKFVEVDETYISTALRLPACCLS